jgi:hypothetical protein
MALHISALLYPLPSLFIELMMRVICSFHDLGDGFIEIGSVRSDVVELEERFSSLSLSLDVLQLLCDLSLESGDIK